MPEVEVIVGASSGSVTVVPSAAGSVTVIEGGSSGGDGSTFQNLFVYGTQPNPGIPFVWIEDLGGGNETWWIGDDA